MLLKWHNMRKHLREQHPDTALPPRLIRWDWPPTDESYQPQGGVGSTERFPCYVCREIYTWRYMKDHFRRKHPGIVMPTRIFKYRWPITQHAAGKRQELQAIAPKTGPPEVPKQQSQSVDNNAFPRINMMITKQS